jgi:hypothetical protein
LKYRRVPLECHDDCGWRVLGDQPGAVGGPEISGFACTIGNSGAEAIGSGDASGWSKYSLLPVRNKVGVPASSARWVIELMALEAVAVCGCWRKKEGVRGVEFRGKVSQAGAEPLVPGVESSMPKAGDWAVPGDVDESVNG